MFGFTRGPINRQVNSCRMSGDEWLTFLMVNTYCSLFRRTFLGGSPGVPGFWSTNEASPTFLGASATKLQEDDDEAPEGQVPRG